MGTAPSRSPCTASSVSSRYSSRSTSWLYRVRSTSTAFPSPRWVITTSSSSERRSSTEASSSRSCLVPTTVTDITFNGTTSCTIGENASQYGRVDVPARDDADELPRPGPARQSGRDTEGSGSFGDHSGAFREQPNGSGRLLERRNERPIRRLADERPHLPEHGSGRCGRSSARRRMGRSLRRSRRRPLPFGCSRNAPEWSPKEPEPSVSRPLCRAGPGRGSSSASSRAETSTRPYWLAFSPMVQLVVPLKVMSVTVVGTRQLRDELASVLERLSELEEVVITQRGEGKAVLVDLTRYNQLVERLEYLEDTLDAVQGEREGAVPIEDL